MEVAALDKYFPPHFKNNQFHCPWCHVYASQRWYPLIPENMAHYEWDNYANRPATSIFVSRCAHCQKTALWADDQLLIPATSTVPPPHELMPGNVSPLYQEAMAVLPTSSRSAAALLRLAVQVLVAHLGGKGDNLNDDIRNLVKAGLPVKAQQALDAVRVIGNNAVHPGSIDFDDTPEVANTLFGLVNHVVEIMIAQPKRNEDFFNSLPSEELAKIKRRDS